LPIGAEQFNQEERSMRTVRVGMVMAMVGVMASAAAGWAEGGQKPAGKAAGPRVVTLGATDQMKFDPATIEAKTGEKLRVVLKPTSAMPKIAMAHNFVILKPGVKAPDFVNAAAMARPDFSAPALKSQVLVATTVAGGGETVSA